MSETVHSEVDSWVNGRVSTSVSLRDRGLAFGDGVFETIRVTDSGPVLFDYHWQRLLYGVERLAIPLNPTLLQDELNRYPGLTPSAASVFEPSVIKIMVTRGEGLRGYQSPKDAQPTRIISCSAAPVYPASLQRDGIEVYACKTRLGHNPVLAGIKHLNRLEQVIARSEWVDTKFHEGLLQDQDGQPVEGTASNFFIVKDQQIFTPSLERCGVKGCMRRWLKDRLIREGYNVVEKSFTMDQLIHCDEWFFCNSVAGVWPVRKFQQNTWPIGTVTRWVLSQVKEHWSL